MGGANYSASKAGVLGLTRTMARELAPGPPVTETFSTGASWRAILVGMFGIVVGNTVNWFAAHIFILYVLQGVLHVDVVTHRSASSSR